FQRNSVASRRERFARQDYRRTDSFESSFADFGLLIVMAIVRRRVDEAGFYLDAVSRDRARRNFETPVRAISFAKLDRNRSAGGNFVAGTCGQRIGIVAPRIR